MLATLFLVLGENVKLLKLFSDVIPFTKMEICLHKLWVNIWKVGSSYSTTGTALKKKNKIPAKYIEKEPDPFLQKGMCQVESTFSSNKSKVPVYSGHPTNYLLTKFSEYILVPDLTWALWNEPKCKLGPLTVEGLDPVKHFILVKWHHSLYKHLRISIYLTCKKHTGENFISVMRESQKTMTIRTKFKEKNKSLTYH